MRWLMRKLAFHLDIYVESIVSTADFSEEIMAKFREAPLVERLGLLSPFKNIAVVDIVSDMDSTSRSGKYTEGGQGSLSCIVLVVECTHQCCTNRIAVCKADKSTSCISND